MRRRSIKMPSKKVSAKKTVAFKKAVKKAAKKHKKKLAVAESGSQDAPRKIRR